MSDAPDCTCGHANYAHDYRYGTCYETGEGRCSCYAYRPAAAEGNET